jgi:hypothetical protein
MKPPSKTEALLANAATAGRPPETQGGGKPLSMAGSGNIPSPPDRPAPPMQTFSRRMNFDEMPEALRKKKD